MAEHAKSEGARYERAAFRSRLRRGIKKAKEIGSSSVEAALQGELNWLLDRQKRYEPRPGGLGRTIRKR